MNFSLKDVAVFGLGASFSALLCMFAVAPVVPLSVLSWSLVAVAFLAALALLFMHVISRPTQGPVDIWDLQRRLMLASDQQMPMSPQLNAGVLLYFALTLEELGEMAKTIHGILLRDKSQRWSRAQMGHLFYSSSSSLAAMSSQVRKVLPAISDLSMPLTLEEAKALFDDTTDVTVTVAGLPISAGLPASSGYLEVLQSNLSKANPATGKIDKTPDGKWIKGRHYVKPDLARVLKQASTADYAVRT